MTARLLRAAALLAALLEPSAAQAVSVPRWMTALADTPAPTQTGSVDDVVLHAETVLTVRGDGRMTRRERKAFRILRDGSQLGTVRIGFDPGSPILSLRAWSVPATGKPFEVGLKDAQDNALGGLLAGQLVTDNRVKVLAIPAAKPGSVIGYEVEQQLPSHFLIDEWDFQSNLLALESSYSLQLPEGWAFQASWVNAQEQSPDSVGARHWQWSARNVAAVPLEAGMPPWRSVAGRMILAILPPQNRGVATFQSWNQVGLWYHDLARGRLQTSTGIKSKVQELSASAGVTGNLQALARYVQREVRYVGIQLGIGALQPHPADQVFASSYGDCKDKATLLATMLKEIGLESHFVLINTERGFVTAASPPQFGFNHMILAIELPADVDVPSAPGAVVHPRLGRLLFFDPTDTFVPLGRLPGSLQGNHGLLVTAQGGELLQLPLSTIDSNGVHRTATLTLDEQGTLKGNVLERWEGDSAIEERRQFQHVDSNTERMEILEGRLSRSLTAFDIDKATVRGGAIPDRPLEWNYTLTAPGYGKPAGDLMLVRPRVFGSLSRTFLESSRARHHPIEFNLPGRYTDVVDITLPAGFVVDELPAAVNEELGFASYHSRFQVVETHTLRYVREFTQHETSVPAAKAETLKALFRRIDVDERASAVIRKSPRSPMR